MTKPRNNRNKSVSTDFAVFLNTFLIISTVIVFAVLVFLSYQNMYGNYLNKAFDSSTDICADVATDLAAVYDSTDDEALRDRLIELYLGSDILDESESIYITDGSGKIVYSNLPGKKGTLIENRLQLALKSSDDKLYQSREEITGTLTHIITALKIGSTGYYVIVMYEVDFTNVISEYMSIVLYPVLIALFAAIALFIGFTGLTIRPLRDISRTVSRVSEGDLTARVDDKYTRTGDSTGILTLSSDLTDMARDVNMMIESLENQEKDRNIFISSVAHDIRTPLTSINGFVTAMLDGTIPPELHSRYLEKIKNEVLKVRNLIVSMTEASSLSSVDPSMMEEFDLKEVLEDMVSELEPQLHSKGITIETRIDEEGGTAVYGEVQQLSRVLSNIVTNAIKFTPDGGRIIISSYPDRREKRRSIIVEDSGPGVEPDKRNKVFESFYKADPSRKQEGFGLGLYICKQILLGHGQQIRLDESRELGGAMFIFSFPVPPAS